MPEEKSPDSNGEEYDEQDENRPKEKKQAKHDSGLADLEKVTDYAEETEIGSVNDLSAVSYSLSIIICFFFVITGNCQ